MSRRCNSSDARSNHEEAPELRIRRSARSGFGWRNRGRRGGLELGTNAAAFAPFAPCPSGAADRRLLDHDDRRREYRQHRTGDHHHHIGTSLDHHVVVNGVEQGPNFDHDDGGTAPSTYDNDGTPGSVHDPDHDDDRTGLLHGKSGDRPNSPSTTSR